MPHILPVRFWSFNFWRYFSCQSIALLGLIRYFIRPISDEPSTPLASVASGGENTKKSPENYKDSPVKGSLNH